jgi:hypothetical protein
VYTDNFHTQNISKIVDGHNPVIMQNLVFRPIPNVPIHYFANLLDAEVDHVRCMIQSLASIIIKCDPNKGGR